ncbi:MAG: exonuclease domain-containing protein, partial [Pseudomonadota bacterium]
MWDSFFSADRQRRKALQKAPESPLREFLGTPFPDRRTDCRKVGIVSVDLETTGLDPERDAILSLGVVEMRGMSIKLGTAWHEILRVDREIPEETAIIHHITDDRAAAGAALEDILPVLLRRLAGKVLLAHYAPIEKNFLDTACRQLYGAPFVVPTIDTLVLAQRILERRNASIQTGDLRLFNLRPRYNLPRYKAHNALSDA